MFSYSALLYLQGLVLECKENCLREAGWGGWWRERLGKHQPDNLVLLRHTPCVSYTVLDVFLCLLVAFLYFTAFVSENVSPPSGMDVLHMYRMCVMLSFEWALLHFSGHIKFDLDSTNLECERLDFILWEVFPNMKNITEVHE